MNKKTIDAICLAISGEFGAEFEIYTEYVEQGLQEPCFFISCVESTNELFRGKRYFVCNQFCVEFLSTPKNVNEQCNNVQDRLQGCLEIINIDGDKTRGTKGKIDFSDGKLRLLINYDVFVDRDDELELMETFEVDTEVESGE